MDKVEIECSQCKKLIMVDRFIADQIEEGYCCQNCAPEMLWNMRETDIPQELADSEGRRMDRKFLLETQDKHPDWCNAQLLWMVSNRWRMMVMSN